MGGEFLSAHGPQFAWILGAMTEPAFKVFAIEEGIESCGWVIEPVMIC